MVQFHPPFSPANELHVDELAQGPPPPTRARAQGPLAFPQAFKFYIFYSFTKLVFLSPASQVYVMWYCCKHKSGGFCRSLTEPIFYPQTVFKCFVPVGCS